ncbi:permease [Tibeticola sp.]|uniref:permease n=1 Tax=Tibeticola sp. TaxID=2005368 RepID=UPI0025D2FE28|nr:permease [Tibeticola sp.]
MNTLTAPSKPWPLRQPVVFLVLAAVVWLAIYKALDPASEALVAALPVDRDSHLGGALQFFLYDAPKVLMLLTGVVFVMGMVNSYFTPERTRALLAGRTEGVANVMAASLGIVTPFCSCSAVPLFIGFVQAGVPLGVTFSFLIAAPMVNEVALTLLFGMFGWKVAALYLGLGLTVAIVSGWIIGRLKMERYLEDWVRDMPKVSAAVEEGGLTLSDRIEAGFKSVRDIVGKVWPYILAGIGIGAVIHGYVPEDFMASIMGKQAWWAVPLAVLVGVPMYTNAAGVIPIVQALLAKGAALGTVLAFMMSVIALSLPEMIILRKVLKLRLIATFAGIVAAGILLVGFVFNAVL